jgi:lysophospholipase
MTPADTTPAASLVALAKNPVPSAATVGFVSTIDGRRLRYAHWQPTGPDVRGTCVIVQGRTEFIEKYFEVVADLRRRGFAVATFDLRGQGGSDRALSNATKGHVRHFSEYLTDLETIVRNVVEPELPEPWIGLGHSLGGHILLRHAMTTANSFDRIIVTCPMIRIHDRQLPRLGDRFARISAGCLTVAGFATAFVPGGGPPLPEGRPFEQNDLTSDRERYQRALAVLRERPDLAIGAPTIGWMWAAYQSMSVLQHPDAPRAVKVPMLAVAAGDDQVVSTTAVEELALRVKLGSRVLIPTSRHEVLQETDAIRSRFWAAFDAYMDAQSVAA